MFPTGIQDTLRGKRVTCDSSQLKPCLSGTLRGGKPGKAAE